MRPERKYTIDSEDDTVQIQLAQGYVVYTALHFA